MTAIGSPALVSLKTGDASVAIPGSIGDREELLAIVLDRARVREVSRTRWATTWRRGQRRRRGEAPRAMTEGEPERQTFRFTPDWRAQLPVALMPLKVALGLGVPAVFGWLFWTHQGLFMGIVVWVLAGLAGARNLAWSLDADFKYRRKILHGAIELDAEGIRLPLPGDEWADVPWDEVRELHVIRASGLLGEGLIRVLAPGRQVAIPGYVDDRAELLLEIRKRARLIDARHGWWATVWGKGEDRGG